MITKILSGILLSAVLVSVVLGWQLKKEIARSGELRSKNEQLTQDLVSAGEVNQRLVSAIKSIMQENIQLQKKISRTEKAKTQIAQEIEVLRDEITEGNKEAPQWSEAPIPRRVRDGVTVAIERLYKPASDYDNRGGDS